MNYKEFDREFNDEEFKLFLKARVSESQMISTSQYILQLLALTFNAGKIAKRNEIKGKTDE